MELNGFDGDLPARPSQASIKAASTSISLQGSAASIVVARKRMGKRRLRGGFIVEMGDGGENGQS